ncbi:hypothetical protein MAC_06501 [Metarhizium acridum CQMa 102]|uniref:Uncharacterized protein n=1 Tax=Metarhizium acridum (strain CQMa 102) TaxID=655827 RepID=E9E9F3_METAQ|nr:uncharacterized protein MAC_06501 [Metarhizium acridum CQMa 102]EFY87393.1 hypothetical protein MAC_06501 [Metarhizium acridum CQMa 102]
MAVKRSLPISQDITQSVEEHNAVSGAGHKQEESEQEHDSDSDNSVLDTDDPYDSDGAEDTESDDEDSNNTTNQGGQSQQFTQAGDPMDLDEAEEDHEIVRKHKALCYEDIVLWLVQDPNGGDRDVLAMEVMFRHHKGAKNKPKPYGSTLVEHYSDAAVPLLTRRLAPSFYFAKTRCRFYVP